MPPGTQGRKCVWEGRCMPWGTLNAWRLPLHREGHERKSGVGKDGPSLVLVQAPRHNTDVLPGCPILCLSLGTWVRELRGWTPLPVVCIHACLVCKGEGSVSGGGWLRRGMKWGKWVTFPLHGIHVGTAVLWQEGHPNTLGRCSPPQKLSGLQGMPWVAVLLLMPAVLQDQVISQGHCLQAPQTSGWNPAIYFSLIRQSCDRHIQIPLH